MKMNINFGTHVKGHMIIEAASWGHRAWCCVMGAAEDAHRQVMMIDTSLPEIL